MASKIKIGPYSAYAIAVKYGYQGTEEEWIKEQEANRTASETAAKEAAASAAAALNSAGAAEASSKAAETAKTQAEAAAAKAEAAASAAEKDAGSARSDAQAAAASEQAANASRGSAEASASAAQRSETAAAASASQAASSAAAANETLTQVQTAGQEAQQKVKDAETEALGNISAAAPALPAVSAAAAWQSVTAKSDGSGYNLAAMAPIEATIRPTVTGNPAVCKDSAAWAFQGLKIYGKSTQDGEPSPENPVPIVSAGDGGSVGAEITGSNLIQTHGTETINGVTFTDNGDGTITATGTATVMANYFLTTRQNPHDFKARKTTYYIHGCPSGGAISKYALQWFSPDGSNSVVYDYGSGAVVNVTSLDANWNICISIKSGATVNNLVFKPMVNYGTKAMPFEPYKGLQKITISTLNGLPGIPVESGGNFTDADGQQLVCNYADFLSGKIYCPIKKYIASEQTFKINEVWGERNTNYAFAYVLFPKSLPINMAISNVFKSIAWTTNVSEINDLIIMVETKNGCSVICFSIPKSALDVISPESVKNYMESISAEFIAANDNPNEVVDISDKELAAYRALTTYDGTTVVSTAEPVAGIEASYVMDGNKYRESVDKRLAALEAAQTGI